MAISYNGLWKQLIDHGMKKVKIRGKSHFCRNAQILRKVPGKLTNKHKTGTAVVKLHREPFIKPAGNGR